MVEFLPRDNRITISVLFGLTGLIFFILFFDSHKKAMEGYARAEGFKLT